MKYSIFLPFFNEKKIIESNTKKVVTEMEKIGKTHEIILIDDNSNDGSLRIAKNISKKIKHVKLIHFGDGPSRRENLAKSFLQGKGEIIAFMDIDLATNLKDLQKLLETTERNDISIGSRYHKKSTLKREWWRRLISEIYNFTIRFLFHTDFKDHQCGFKAFKKETIHKLVQKMGYDTSLRRGWFWDVELLVQAKKMNYRIKEIPVDWKSGEQTSFNLIRELKMIPIIIQLFLKMRKNENKKIRN